MASNSSRRSSSSASSRSYRRQPARKPAPARGKGLQRPSASRPARSGSLPLPAFLAAGVAVLSVVGLVAVLLLSQLPVFTITGIDATPSEHMSADTIAKLAGVEEGTTLFNVDVAKIEENVKRNPWAAGVKVTREFPDKLGISVSERKVGAIVLMGSGEVAWYIGDDGVWLEPATLSADGDQTMVDAATKKAAELDCLLITDVPSSVAPKAATQTSDPTVLAVFDYLDAFSPSFGSQISSFSAASVESLSITLKSGVEVSLGSASDISAKQQMIEKVLQEHPNEVTYINVRVPSKPTYRRLEVDASGVKGGTGARVISQPATTDAAKADAAATDAAKSATSDAAAADEGSEGSAADSSTGR